MKRFAFTLIIPVVNMADLKCFSVALVIATVVFSGSVQGYSLRNGTGKVATFTNPIQDFAWPDPYVHRHNDGFYYMPRSESNGVAVYKSRLLSNWRGAEKNIVVRAPPGLKDLWVSMNSQFVPLLY